ncbi:AraC family transcriptional regulator [Variovorax sp. J22P168]|uniref:AraC family transcriptional regulator n=1 Tax=Variovorax jilinensis TaxID=3053513 RepID=UPI0025775416|nr:AraC family transcriptional regulator [Variovorax sp. J22P168]MDM0011682.1 AraC family transcriptional regulator [Variovorax sp. J22P168]
MAGSVPSAWLPPVAGASSDDQGSVRIAALAGVPEVLRERGVDLAQLLAETGLAAATFDRPDNRISYRAGGRLLLRAAEATGCPHFGLLAGQHAHPGSLGQLGELIQRSRTVEAALHSLIAHLHLQTRGGVPTHAIEGLHATFGYAIYLRDMPGTAQAYDLVAAFEFNILRALCGPRWSPVEVSFAHGRPKDIGPYRRLFGCRLVFDADRTELRFERRWLAQPPLASDAERHRHLQREILAQESVAPHALVHHITATLRRMVAEGRASESLLCDRLSMPRRTLHRRLAEQGTSMRVLLEDVRYEFARQLLLDTDLTTAGVAAALDYADASAFNRAFRRWTDTTPAAWRAQAAAASPAAASRAQGHRIR